MFDLSKDVRRLSDLKRNSAEVLGHAKKTNRPVLLTVNGEPAVILQEAAAYQELLNLVRQVESVPGLRSRLETNTEALRHLLAKAADKAAPVR